MSLPETSTAKHRPMLRFDGVTTSEDHLAAALPGRWGAFVARHNVLFTSGSRILGNVSTLASGLGLGGISAWRAVAGILGVAAGVFLLVFGKKSQDSPAETFRPETFVGKLQENSVKIYTGLMLLTGAALTTSGVVKDAPYEMGAGIAMVLGSALQTVPNPWVQRVVSDPIKVGALMKQPPLVLTTIDAIARQDYSRLLTVACLVFANHAEGKLGSGGGRGQ